jgi:hypothetical protein
VGVHSFVLAHSCAFNSPHSFCLRVSLWADGVASSDLRGELNLAFPRRHSMFRSLGYGVPIATAPIVAPVYGYPTATAPIVAPVYGYPTATVPIVAPFYGGPGYVRNLVRPLLVSLEFALLTSACSKDGFSLAVSCNFAFHSVTACASPSGLGTLSSRAALGDPVSEESVRSSLSVSLLHRLSFVMARSRCPRFGLPSRTGLSGEKYIQHVRAHARTERTSVVANE